jgi:hypothetical protein
VQTDRTTPNYKPDIIICVNEKGTCILIDVAIDYFTPTNETNQVLSLIALLKDYPK